MVRPQWGRMLSYPIWPYEAVVRRQKTGQEEFHVKTEAETGAMWFQVQESQTWLISQQKQRGRGASKDAPADFTERAAPWCHDFKLQNEAVSFQIFKPLFCVILPYSSPGKPTQRLTLRPQNRLLPVHPSAAVFPGSLKKHLVTRKMEFSNGITFQLQEDSLYRYFKVKISYSVCSFYNYSFYNYF